MQSQIPLPTDNIYKFYALFGLLVLLTTAVMFFIRHEEYNKAAFERYIPTESLKSKKNLTEVEKHNLLLIEEKAKIAKSDKDFEFRIYFCFFFVGVGFTAYGFYQWHTKVQPNQDKLLDLQIEKAELEIKTVNKHIRRTRFTHR